MENRARQLPCSLMRDVIGVNLFFFPHSFRNGTDVGLRPVNGVRTLFSQQLYGPVWVSVLGRVFSADEFTERSNRQTAPREDIYVSMCMRISVYTCVRGGERARESGRTRERVVFPSSTRRQVSRDRKPLQSPRAFDSMVRQIRIRCVTFDCIIPGDCANLSSTGIYVGIVRRSV